MNNIKEDIQVGNSSIEGEDCPFCGQNELRVFVYAPLGIGDKPDAFVQCMGCTTTGPAAETREEAIELWNARAP